MILMNFVTIPNLNNYIKKISSYAFLISFNFGNGSLWKIFLLNCKTFLFTNKNCNIGTSYVDKIIYKSWNEVRVLITLVHVYYI